VARTKLTQKSETNCARDYVATVREGIVRFIQSVTFVVESLELLQSVAQCYALLSDDLGGYISAFLGTNAST
jgi:hypothetical protein